MLTVMPLAARLKTYPILLANFVQGSSSTFLAYGSPSFFAFQEACGELKFRHFQVRQQYPMSQGSPPRMKMAGYFKDRILPFVRQRRGPCTCMLRINTTGSPDRPSKG